MIPESDLKISVHTFPQGGQTVGVADTGVQVTHVPSGCSVTCTTERSQLMNKARALRYLEAMLAGELEG